jgi:hypothetical protein
MKALILNGEVVQLSENTFEVHESFSWVDATADAEVGGSWDGTSFGPADTRTAEQKAADALASLRSERNKKLRETDYLALSDNTLSAEMVAYRQALRDITNTFQSVNDEGFAWPTKPE